MKAWKLRDLLYEVRSRYGRLRARYQRIPQFLRVLILIAVLGSLTCFIDAFVADIVPGTPYAHAAEIEEGNPEGSRQETTSEPPEQSQQVPLSDSVALDDSLTSDNESNESNESNGSQNSESGSNNQEPPVVEPESEESEPDAEPVLLEPDPIPIGSVEDSTVLVDVNSGDWNSVFAGSGTSTNRVFDPDTGELESSTTILITNDGFYYNEDSSQVLAQYQFNDQNSHFYDGVSAVGVIVTDDEGIQQGILLSSCSDEANLIRQFLFGFDRTPLPGARLSSAGIWYGDLRTFEKPDGTEGSGYAGLHPKLEDGTELSISHESQIYNWRWGNILSSVANPPVVEPDPEPVLPDPVPPVVEPEPEEPEPVVESVPEPEPTPISENLKTGIPAESSVMAQTGDSMPYLVVGLSLVALMALMVAFLITRKTKDIKE